MNFKRLFFNVCIVLLALVLVFESWTVGRYVHSWEEKTGYLDGCGNNITYYKENPKTICPVAIAQPCQYAGMLALVVNFCLFFIIFMIREDLYKKLFEEEDKYE